MGTFGDDDITGVGYGESKRGELLPLVPEGEALNADRFGDWLTSLLEQGTYQTGVR